MNLPKYVGSPMDLLGLCWRLSEQRQDNITTVLDLLETKDFYSRLYSLQLLSCISGARPERTQEAILTAPLGISRIANILGDAREPVRNGKVYFTSL